jgi:hypothetical protein
VGDSSYSYGKYVGPDQSDEHQGDQHDVPHQHLAEVHEIEKGPDADRVEGIFAAGGFRGPFP